MPKFTITFSKENMKRIYQTIVSAESEKEAFCIARDEAESKGLELPDEIWTRTHQHKGT